MLEKNLILGIDTSNYKTSVALVDRNGEIVYNHQQFLKVKTGERGLRQSEALFQHLQNLPDVLVHAINDETRSKIAAVSVSSKPRPIEGSYMPVFTVGINFGKVISSALNIPMITFSHQEGHIEAVKYYSSMNSSNDLICFHFSGGTTEAVLYKKESDRVHLEIVGGSKDLAFGQVLDRAGVALGYAFPCGDVIDKLALEAQSQGISDKSILTKIKVTDGFINLSGIDTQASRAIGKVSENLLSAALMERLSEAVLSMTMQLSKKYEINDFLYAGGVSGSDYLKQYLRRQLPHQINTAFGNPTLSSDNAVGIALLGGQQLWR